MKRNPEKSVAEDKEEAFLSRWSRKKEQERRAPPPEPAQKSADPNSPAPELPPVDKLDLESDYRPFFHPKVDEDVRRSALKKLFSDPRFNVMDGLDVYIDDYSKTEPIPPEMLAGLRQAQNILQWAKEDAEERDRKEREKERQLQASGGPARAIEPPAAPVSGAADAAPAGLPDAPETPKS